jgi:hypothetical protein
MAIGAPDRWSSLCSTPQLCIEDRAPLIGAAIIGFVYGASVDAFSSSGKRGPCGADQQGIDLADHAAGASQDACTQVGIDPGCGETNSSGELLE